MWNHFRGRGVDIDDGVESACRVGWCLASRSGEPESEVPTVAEIRCEEGAAKALSHRVQPQRDGVHVHIENESGARQYYIRSALDEAQNHGGRLRKDESIDIRTTMPPGDILIGCFDNSRDIPYNER